MATIDLGRLGFVNKGTYNNSTTYEKNDLVQFTDGGILSTYLYIDSTAQSGQAPSSSGTAGSRWVYFAKGVADAVASAGNNKVLVTDGSGSLSPLSIGSASQVLKTNSSANGFEFGDVSGGVIQTKMAMDGSTYSVNTQVVPGGTVTSCYEVAGLTLTLTPSSTSSKFLIDLNLMACHEGGYMAGGYITYQVSGGTEYAIASSGTRGITFRVDADLSSSDIGQGTTNPMAMIAPNTTSAITFRCRVFKADVNTANIFINRSPNNATDEDDGGFTISSMMVTELDGSVSTVSSTNMDIQNT